VLDMRSSGCSRNEETMQLSRPSYCRFEAGLKKRLAKAEKGRMG
jgi:hypothetical protein